MDLVTISLSLCASIISILIVKEYLKPESTLKKINELYNQLNNINVNKGYKSIGLILKTSADTVNVICEVQYNKLQSYLYTPKKLNNHIYFIPYFIGNTWYKALIPYSTHPSIITSIHNENKDVTKEIRPYLGPSERINIDITPLDLGFDQLTFSFLFHPDKTFKANDYIII
jgi:hypothetical protein